MENDDGNPDEYKDEIDLLVSFGIEFLPFPVPDFIKGWIVDAINWIAGSADDLVATTVSVIEVDALRRMALSPLYSFRGYKKELQYVGGEFVMKLVEVPTDILTHFSTKHEGGDGLYNICFRLKKTDVPGGMQVPGEVPPVRVGD